MNEKFKPLSNLDFGLLFEDGGRGYARNVVMVALVLFVGMLLLFISAATVIGIVFALPHLAVGLGLVGYYMTKGKVPFSSLFTGFKKYGRVIGTMLIAWILFIGITFIFSGPYYYYLIKAMNAQGVSGEWAQRFLTASLSPEVQNWSALQYAAYPFQFYFQGRFLPLFPLLIDEDLSIGEAIATSWAMTAKIQWYLVLFILLVNVIAVVAVFVGILGLFFGIFFTLPFPMALLGAATKQLMESGRGETAA